MGFAQSTALQEYQTLALIAQQLFGKGEKNSDPERQSSETENVMRPQNIEEMKQAFGMVFGNV